MFNKRLEMTCCGTRVRVCPYSAPDVELEFNRGLGMDNDTSTYWLSVHNNTVLRMDSFLLSRELGDLQASASLMLECNTRLIHSVQRATGIVFCEESRASINALDIEKQTSR